MANQAGERLREVSYEEPASGTFRHRGGQTTRASALHDARNLLSVIVANVGWLGEHVDGELAEVLDDVTAATARLQALIEGALSSTDDRDRAATLAYRLARVSDILRDGATGLRRPLRGVRVEIARRGEDVVEVDDSLIIRVIANLLDNAVRHSPDGGVVRLDADVTDQRLKLTVRDEGPGVAPDRRDAIFRTAGAGSTHGLGLAFCRRAVLEHGGTIELVDADRGATFEVVLPSQAP